MSKHVLVTLLGRARQSYEAVRYRFPDGSERATPFFGLALADHLQPDRLLILGTRASMWDTLVEHLAPDDADEDLRLRLRLMDASKVGEVDQSLLDAAKPLLERALKRSVDARLVGFADTIDEQVSILQAISEGVGRDDASIDVTHGFRHLGMLGLESAFLLGKTRAQARQGASVRGIWYGALDMRQGDLVPVLQLDGLLELREWVTALARFDESGNYAVFAPLLERDGVDRSVAQCLRDAWFLESNLNLSAAREKLLAVDRALRGPSMLAGAGALFRPRLLERLSWIKRDNLREWQHNLAHKALARRDYLRAAIFGTEAVITHACIERGGAPHEKKDREDAKVALQKELPLDENKDWRSRAFKTLTGVRNAMAHAMPGKDSRLNELLRDERRLEEEMSRCLEQLAPP